MADKKTKIQNVSDVLKGAATAASAVKAVSGILNKDSNDLVGGAIGTAQGIVGNLNNQIPDVPDIPNPQDVIPDVPNPKDVVPEIPEIPKIGGLIGSLPIPQFRKPEPVKVDPPPQPKKLEKQSKIPNVPKESQPSTGGTTFVTPPTLTEGNISDIPPEFRKVIGGSAFDEATRQGRIFYGRDAGFGQIQVYAVSNSTQKVVGPFRTSGTGVIFS